MDDPERLSAERPTHGGICPYCKEAINPEALRCKHCTASVGPARIGEKWGEVPDTGPLPIEFVQAMARAAEPPDGTSAWPPDHGIAQWPAGGCAECGSGGVVLNGPIRRPTVRRLKKCWFWYPTRNPDGTVHWNQFFYTVECGASWIAQ